MRLSPLFHARVVRAYHGDVDTINAIKPQRRDPQRAVIKAAGQIVATLTYEMIHELGLAVDQPWTEAMAVKVARAQAYDQCLQAALRRLNRRAMSCSQLRIKLRGLDFYDDVIDRVMERLTRIGLLDDAAFGRALIRDLRRSKPAGPKLASQKLFQKGLDRALIDQLVRETFAQTDQVRDAVALAQRKAKTLARYDGATQKRRLWSLLVRRGFDHGVIEQALGDMLTDCDDGVE